MKTLRIFWVLAVAVIILLTGACKTGHEEKEPDIHIGLLGPPNGAKIDHVVTFQWYVGRGVGDVEYDAFVLTDKGVNPFDGYREDEFYAGKNATELTIDLFRSGWYYHGTPFDWGVWIVTPDGRSYRSETWRARIR